MQGDVQDDIEQHLLTTVEGATIAAGYDLPANFRLVTREALMWDQVGGLYPAAIIQPETRTSEALELSYAHEGVLTFRVIVYFQVGAGDIPIRHALRYLKAIQRAYMQDITRGGLADITMADDTPTPLIWRDNGSGTVFEATARGRVIYEYDPRAA